VDAAVEGDGDLGRRAFELVLHGAAPEAVEAGGEHVPVRDGRAAVADGGEPFRVTFDA
jgi:hypothetical protein